MVVCTIWKKYNRNFLKTLRQCRNENGNKDLIPEDERDIYTLMYLCYFASFRNIVNATDDIEKE